MIWLIVIIVLILTFPYLSRLLRQWMMKRFFRMAEDRFRRNMGVPPGFGSSDGREDSRDNMREETPKKHSEPLIPREYAVDVEYTEIREYSTTTEIHPSGDGVTIRQESQVTDAEYIVIRPGQDNRLPSEKKKGWFSFGKKRN